MGMTYDRGTARSSQGKNEGIASETVSQDPRMTLKTASSCPRGELLG